MAQGQSGSTPPPPGSPVSPSSPCAQATGRHIPVADTAALRAALQSAAPGDAVELADGEYAGTFELATSGTADAPILMCGSANAQLRGPSQTTGYTLWLHGAQHWQLHGFSVRGGQKGVMLDDAHNNLLDALVVFETGNEGIHLRKHSSHNVLDSCVVHTTGQTGDPKYGEGIYIGSAQSNWCKLTAGTADESNDNTIVNCTVRSTTAECIDVKEGTQNAQIVGNRLDGAGIVAASGADSLVNVKGSNHVLRDNMLTHAPADVLSVHVVLEGWGRCNRFEHNIGVGAASGYGVHVGASPLPPTAVGSNNSFPDAQAGLSNVAPDAALDAASCRAGTMQVACGT
jgi:hypothetical protein